ncbi:hypothetical protein SEPCBS119000_000950 [Sporothrix epigloea]|uniref:DnaJ homologue subfamily C member 28 conserved domain-containing protein n=1 Tax=Sporothrix epigloea TaxID=1892477 RepID=A0ABP0D933_9PEZI
MATDTSTAPPAATAGNEIQSAMSRRLEEATEDALLTGGRAGRRAVEEAGFSEELKDRLISKIADAEYRSEYNHTLAAAGLDSQTLNSLGRSGAGTRDLAAAQPWTGEEAPEDTILRMLHDARKALPPDLRSRPAIPKPDPVVVDMRLRRAPSTTPGQRAANARDLASGYVGRSTESASPDEKQRDAFRKELRDRFGSGVGAANMPNSFTGLAGLANERIEDAIARGQFRDIPRGPGVARDARADNPFIDTTEYIMNKMIQRQEIVPPWIEKQQELVRTARVFRTQLRSDWRRHAARTLASRGGTLQEQMAAATRYAAAEQAHNPRSRDVEQISVATNHTDDAVMRAVSSQEQESTTLSESTPSAGIGMTRPLRDAQWEATEQSYLELSISQLNALTRSYNLMAPELAKKPYFSLERELKACYADVAPTLAETIRDRAARPPKPSGDEAGAEALSRRMFEKFIGEGASVRVYDSRKPNYGLREMWRDWWTKKAPV